MHQYPRPYHHKTSKKLKEYASNVGYHNFAYYWPVICISEKGRLDREYEDFLNDIKNHFEITAWNYEYGLPIFEIITRIIDSNYSNSPLKLS
jgi:hypothetical protein